MQRNKKLLSLRLESLNNFPKISQKYSMQYIKLKPRPLHTIVSVGGCLLPHEMYRETKPLALYARGASRISDADLLTSSQLRWRWRPSPPEVGVGVEERMFAPVLDIGVGSPNTISRNINTQLIQDEAFKTLYGKCYILLSPTPLLKMVISLLKIIATFMETFAPNF